MKVFVAGATGAIGRRLVPILVRATHQVIAATRTPAKAAAIGAKAPWRVPTFVGRLVIGEAGLVLMEDSRGASKEKAKRELGWKLAWPSWREGFKRGLSDSKNSRGI